MQIFKNSSANSIRSLSPGDAIFDIGANIGFYAQLLDLRRSYVEPQPIVSTAEHRVL
jgi:hypothetical protein